jgi:hypothetical protein
MTKKSLRLKSSIETQKLYQLPIILFQNAGFEDFYSKWVYMGFEPSTYQDAVSYVHHCTI